MSDWANRPVYDKITRHIIAAIPDDLLAWAMFDHLLLRIGKDHINTFKIIVRLPDGFGVIYFLFALDGEIGNGGFEQYFFNRNDEYAEQHLAALEAIGASTHVQVFQKAFTIREAEKLNDDLQQRYAEGTLEAFFSTYGVSQLDTCDREWYALKDELDAKIIGYIRGNPELFVIDDLLN